MNPLLNDLAAKAGVTWFDYQLEAFEQAEAMTGPSPKRCLYYKTGAGKSITALADMVLWGQTEVLVITPPATFPQWEEAGRRFGVDVECMSHAKFRMKDTLVSRHKAIIADEIHQFGGHGGKGWQKLDRLARSLQAPLILASATPNYNDADRVYCIQHILDPHSCKGGFLQFLYAHCVTEQNPFGAAPIVTGFQRFPDAAEYLAALPGVDYLPDDLVYQINDVPIPALVSSSMDLFGYNRRDHRVIASQIEERHTRIYQALVDEHGCLEPVVYDVLTDLVGAATTPVLVYSDHSTVAEALSRSLNRNQVAHDLVTGDTSKKRKAESIAAFLRGELDVLVGTASLATGTDGMDKVCDWLVILDDTQDDSLRRQLIGRIMPRGAGGNAATKQVYRLILV